MVGVYVFELYRSMNDLDLDFTESDKVGSSLKRAYIIIFYTSLSWCEAVCLSAK